MKVGLISPGWPSSHFSNGIATYVDILTGGLTQLGLEVKVLAGATEGAVPPNVLSLKQLTNPENCLKFLKRFVSKEHHLGDPIGVSKHFMKLEFIEKFVPIQKISDQLVDVDRSLLDESTQTAFNAFEEAIERRNNGIPDEW